MTDFSQDPDQVLAANLTQGYVGLRIQQGVPILDRDLNLLSDLVAATVRSVVSRYLGSGVAVDGSGATPKRSSAFAIAAVDADDDFVITAGSPGRCLVDGIEVTIDGDRRYTAQGPPAPPPLSPPASGTRVDVVYLDAFVATDETGDVMKNPEDVIVQTSVRLKPAWVVRVAEGGAVPSPDPGHGHLVLAEIVRNEGEPRITRTAIVDRRAHCFALADVRRMVLEPILWNVPPPTSQPGQTVDLTGRNLQFLDDDVVTVVFRNSEEVTVSGADLTPTSLHFTVPEFDPVLEAQTDLTLTVRTDYGSAQTTITIVPN